MHAPSFWYEKKRLAAILLQPLAMAYAATGKILRGCITPVKVSVPVICVGNVLVGGTGKTPMVVALAKMLIKQGKKPHILSRGYGGYLCGPVRVDPSVHTLGEVGDEPLLLARHAPVWVSKNKVAGAKAAIDAGAEVLLMDDGLQNPSLYKDVTLLVMNASRGLGNGCVLPAGPLREPFADALAKSHAVIWLGVGSEELQKTIAAQKPLLQATAATLCLTHDLNDKRLFAFCGLGHAQKFFDGVKALGGNIVKTLDFPDHYVWTVHELEQILAEAKALNALPVTTVKDAMRIPKSLLNNFAICDVALSFENERALEKLLNV